ncbi:hypothetical protein QNI16_34215 [Cytophagaceae bacterium YF14B1]|uniref:Uncharacterized protein n=1 Tax=Xanthocytophaga flava TaxID=3048013 RepID=A0AAE3UAI8_9BACT|nr:hypothetical protein [Xanthocytophaga flavus]MDJ1485596.1 hypothetical protein [Xanthocytophaga flavus]
MVTYLNYYTVEGNEWQSLLQTLEQVKVAPFERSNTLFPPDALQTINPIALQRLGAQTYEKLRLNWSLTDLALIDAKKGALESSAEKFSNAYEQFDDLSGESLLLAQTLYHSRIAYFYYRTSQFDNADKNLARTLEIDDMLQGIYPVLHGHKLHVLQNKSRTLALRKRYGDGAHLLTDILHYMINSRHKPYQRGVWGKQLIMKEAAFQPTHVAFEFTIFYFCRDCYHFPAFETEVIRNSGGLVKSLRKVALHHPVYQTTLDWLQTKRALYVQDSLTEYISRTDHFIRTYSERYNLFKLLLLMDLFRALTLLGFKEESQTIQAFIGDYHAIQIAA